MDDMVPQDHLLRMIDKAIDWDFLVTHRLTTIRNCDKIYEIKDGAAWLREKEEILKDL